MAWVGGDWRPVACYAAILAGITAIAIWCGPETDEENISIDSTSGAALTPAGVPLRT